MWQVQTYNDLEVEMTETEYEALEGADALLLITEWNEFRTPDFDKIKSLLREPVIFDGRNVYDLELMKERGFYYNSIGRGVVNAFRRNNVEQQ